MAKQRERYYDDDGETAQVLFGDIDLDDDAFFDQIQPKKTRQCTKRARYARRRIEERLEERQLAHRLREFYD